MPTGQTTYGGGTRSLPEGWDTLAPQLAEQKDDIRISKSAWSSFTDTALDAQLRERGVTQAVIIGLATSFGVESTARSAYDLGYDVVIVSDAIADVSPAGSRVQPHEGLPNPGPDRHDRRDHLRPSGPGGRSPGRSTQGLSMRRTCYEAAPSE